LRRRNDSLGDGNLRDLFLGDVFSMHRHRDVDSLILVPFCLIQSIFEGGILKVWEFVDPSLKYLREARNFRDETVVDWLLESRYERGACHFCVCNARSTLRHISCFHYKKRKDRKKRNGKIRKMSLVGEKAADRNTHAAKLDSNQFL